MTMRKTLVALCTALALLPLASGHGAPDPAETATRLLHDLNDDCGHEDALGNDCRGGHDLIALDLQERWDGSRDVVILRLFMDKATDYPVQDVIKVGGATVTLSTSNDQTFSVTGAQSVSSPKSLNDGTRFSLDVTLTAQSLGGRGATLSGFSVESRVGGQGGDVMPGACSNSVGPCTTQPSQSSTAYERSSGYTLRGPTYYVQATGPSKVSVNEGREQLANLQIKNLLRTTSQNVIIQSAAANGVDVAFHVGGNPSGASYKSSVSMALSGSSTSTLHMRVQGLDAGATGSITVTYTTDQGGRGSVEVPYEVLASDAPVPPPASPSGGNQSSPGPGIAVLVALAVAVLAFRRN